MNKKYILKNKLKFNELIKTGKKVKNSDYVIYFLPNFELKIGFTIGTKFGKAYLRNYHRRVIKSIAQQNMDNFHEGYYVIIGRENLKNITFEQKKKSLLNLLERIKNEK